jgi:hypothetical protein
MWIDGSIPCELPPSVGVDGLLELLARAEIQVTPDKKHPQNLAYFARGMERLWVALPELSTEPPNRLNLSPDSRGDALLCEVLRMLYASGAQVWQHGRAGSRGAATTPTPG